MEKFFSKATNTKDSYLPSAGFFNSFNFTNSIIIAISIFIDETH